MHETTTCSPIILFKKVSVLAMTISIKQVGKYLKKPLILATYKSHCIFVIIFIASINYLVKLHFNFESINGVLSLKINACRMDAYMNNEHHQK